MSPCGYIARTIHTLLLFTLTTVLAQNRLVSNGTCYYAAGKEADDVYIPCGNDAFGVYACCMNGDKCLSSNACYNGKYGDTYIAGCTDSAYSDPACGNKGAYGDLQWASLVRCFVSNDTSTNDEEWAACYESNQPVVTQHDGGCVCTASAHTAVFTDNPVLTDFAVLPAATGETISFQPGHTPPSDLTPTAQTQSSTTSTSSETSSTSKATTASSTSTSTTENSAAAASSTGPSSTSTTTPTSHGLSTGAEAGIGIGAGLGVLLVCAILFLLYRRRVKQRHSSPNTSDQAFISPYTDQNESWSSPGQGQHFNQKAGAMGAAADMRSPAWSGHKSELPAEERSALMGSSQPSTMALSSGASEVEGTFMTRTSYTGIGRLSPSLTASGGGTGTNSTNRGSWAQPRMGANIRDVHELPGSPPY